MAIVLALTSNRYGYHRDELYFRMLDPAWGYVDQPPLTPLLARAFSAVIADEVWAIRIPAMLAAVASVLVVALITREFGGGRSAQAWCAWGYAFASLPLAFGHILLTASLDLVVWPAVALFAVRAVLREQPAWWLAAGAVVGVSTYNKLLVVLLVAALAAGLLLVGPRRELVSRGLLAGAALAVVIALPNLVYQASHGWPQLEMGAALAENNADEVRVMMWPFLFLALGPPLALVAGAGLVALVRRPAWRRARFLAAAFPVLLVLSWIAAGQAYYPSGLVTVLFAVGCVPLAEALSRSRRLWRVLAVAAVVVNAAICLTVSLPVLPLSALGSSPVLGVNPAVADQVGWPEYVRQVADVYDALPAADAAGAVVIATNYGEAGAIDRYGPALGLPEAYSGHNELYHSARPPDDARVAIIVGAQADSAARSFGSCDVAARLDNGVDVDNEEQGEPVMVCRDPQLPWDELWPRFQHLD